MSWMEVAISDRAGVTSLVDHAGHYDPPPVLVDHRPHAIVSAP